DDENFLQGIFEIAGSDAEALKGAPDEVGVERVDLGEGRGVSLGRGRHDEGAPHLTLNARASSKPPKNRHGVAIPTPAKPIAPTVAGSHGGSSMPFTSKLRARIATPAVIQTSKTTGAETSNPSRGPSPTASQSSSPGSTGRAS